MLIKNGLLVDPKEERIYKADLRVEEGKITLIAEDLEALDGEEIIDVAGNYVAPGLIDGHVHFRDPGLTYKEDIHTGALSAAAFARLAIKSV